MDFTVLAPDSELSDVRDVLVDQTGRIWVLSSFEPHVTVLAADPGTVVRFGLSGPGPGGSSDLEYSDTL
jgi:hypothetical protein